MRKILLASHGLFSKGIYNASEIICGKQDNVSYLSAYIDETPLQTKLDEYFNNISINDDVIVLTDIYNGSVNSSFIPYIQSHNIKLISGMNLALVISIIMEEPKTDSEIEELINSSKEQIIYINKAISTINSTDDFDF